MLQVARAVGENPGRRPLYLRCPVCTAAPRAARNPHDERDDHPGLIYAHVISLVPRAARSKHLQAAGGRIAE